MVGIRLSLRSPLEWLFDITYDREATRHKYWEEDSKTSIVDRIIG